MPERDRDQSFEHILRRVMSNGTPLQNECVDGETLAAWSEGSLHGAQASAVENHVADCARCRALMASLLRTTPEEPATEPLWRRWHLGWAVPLATAATAAAIWVALPDSRTVPAVPQETGELARDERGAAVPSPPAAESASTPAAAAPQATARALQPAEARVKATESETNEVQQRAEADATRESADLDGRAPSVAASPAAGAVARAPAPQSAPPAAAAEQAEADTRKEVSNSGVAPLAAARQAFSSSQIVAPGGSVRWRIVNGRQVQRSENAGADWAPAMISSAGTLATGAAPSNTVCWLVGAGGGVYLTTDGTRFTHLPFPEQVDLVSVSATDDQTATVSASDGRSWRTTDRGRSWETQ